MSKEPEKKKTASHCGSVKPTAEQDVGLNLV